MVDSILPVQTVNVRAVRDELGMTRRQLAAALDLHEQTIIRYENGQRSPDATMMLLALEAVRLGKGEYGKTARARAQALGWAGSPVKQPVS